MNYTLLTNTQEAVWGGRSQFNPAADRTLMPATRRFVAMLTFVASLLASSAHSADTCGFWTAGRSPLDEVEGCITDESLPARDQFTSYVTGLKYYVTQTLRAALAKLDIEGYEDLYWLIHHTDDAAILMGEESRHLLPRPTDTQKLARLKLARLRQWERSLGTLGRPSRSEGALDQD